MEKSFKCEEIFHVVQLVLDGPRHSLTPEGLKVITEATNFMPGQDDPGDYEGDVDYFKITFRDMTGSCWSFWVALEGHDQKDWIISAGGSETGLSYARRRHRAEGESEFVRLNDDGTQVDASHLVLAWDEPYPQQQDN